MKSFIVFFTFLVLGFSAPISLAQDTKPSRFIQVSKTWGRYFEYASGERFIPIGLSLAWPRFVNENDEQKGLEKMEFYFQQLSKNGGNFARIWLSAPFWEIERKSGVYDSMKLNRIVKLLELARKYNIRLKLCLENFRQLSGSPAPFPGSVPFEKAIYDLVNGGPLLSMTQYLNSSSGHELYLKRSKLLADVSKNNEIIFAWELWNEMNAVKGTGWEDWTEVMLDSIQRVFPNHLITQSLGSYDKEEYRPMYKRIVSLPGNDFAQVHRYLDEGSKWDITVSPMDQMASQATSELLSMTVDKPVLVAEIGAVEANHAGPWRLYPKDTLGVLLHDMVFAPFFSGAAGPGHSWHWDSYVEKNDLWWHFGRFNEAIKHFDPVEQRAVPFAGELDGGIRFYGLKGRDEALIWLRDAEATWKSELIDGKSPRLISSRVVSFSGIEFQKVDFYNPWTNRWSKGKSSSYGVVLPGFERSLVIKCQLKNVQQINKGM